MVVFGKLRQKSRLSSDISSSRRVSSDNGGELTSGSAGGTAELVRKRRAGFNLRWSIMRWLGGEDWLGGLGYGLAKVGG